MPFAPDGGSTVDELHHPVDDAALEERGRRGCNVRYARRPADERSWRLGPTARLVATVLAVASVMIGPARAGAGAGARADAATIGRAGVVIDLGNGTVRRVGITVSGSVTGIDALRAAGFEPSIRAYGGLGGAVCALEVGGTVLGCPTDSSCLTCAAPNYWVYFRAPAGSSAFTAARTGAGATTVRDGDIEGWRWGHGAPPAFVALDDFFPPPTTTVVTHPTTTSLPAPTTTTPPGATTTTSATPPPTTAATPTTRPATVGGAALSSTNQPPSTTTDPPPRPPAANAASDSAPARSLDAADAAPRRGFSTDGRAVADGPPVVRTARPSGVAPAGAALFVLVAAGFGGAIVVARRRRAAA